MSWMVLEVAESAVGSTSVLSALALIAVCGAVGGLVSYLTTSGLRRRVTVEGGPRERGFVATMLIGATSAVTAWIAIDGHADLFWQSKLPSPVNLGACAAAFGIGLGGGKAAAETSKTKVLAHAGAVAAAEPENADLAAALSTGNVQNISQALK